jgi:hypothetical protein
MRRASSEAWQASEGLEANGQVELSRHRGRSSQQKIFGIDQPYMARGYRGIMSGSEQ